MEISTEIKDILHCLIRKEIAGDECFCMVLSLVGYEAAQKHFLQQIDSMKSGHPQLYNQLVNIYCGYFDAPIPPLNLPDKLDCAVENGFYATDDDMGYSLDLEMALKLSVEDTQTARAAGNRDEPPSKRTAGVSYSGVVAKNMSQYHNPNIEPNTQQVPPDRSQQASHQLPHPTSIVNHTPGLDHFTTNMINSTEKPVQRKKKKKGKKKHDIERPMSNAPVICWFRRDLRLYDNPALVAASQTGAPVIPLFLWSDTEEGTEKALATGGASKYWLHMALPTLNRDMTDKFNNPIVFRKSDSYLQDLTDIVNTTGAKTLFMNDVYEPYLKSRDDKICKVLKSKGVSCERFHSYLLHEPGSIRTESLCMRGIGSVSHFMECCRQSSPEPVGAPLDPPHSLPAGTARPYSMAVNDLELGKLPRRKDGTIIDWATEIRAGWDFSENGAWEALQTFLSDGKYKPNCS